MLLFADSMNQLSFSKLMAVYSESNRERGREIAPEETAERQIALAESDFYQYLSDCFFRQRGARYAIWEEDGSYFSALRLEPYDGGLLLEALETSPEQRKRGYATKLICAVQSSLEAEGAVTIFSHVRKRNRASLSTHRRCGFSVYKDYSVYIDGSIDSRAYTMIYKK